MIPLPFVGDWEDIDRRQAYLHLRAAEQSLFQASLYLTANDQPTESNEVIELRKGVLSMMERIEVPGD